MPANELSIKFLKNGILALSLAGLYSIILVILRTPIFAKHFQNPIIFKLALITHVNLSVLMWLITITCVVWSLGEQLKSIEVYNNSLFLATILIALSPLVGGEPLMNNYVPILENILFITGLSLLLTIVLLFACQNMFNIHHSFIDICKATSSLIFILSMGCFLTSFIQLKEIVNIIEMDIQYYYEILFWSFGHLIQFLYTQILMTVWLIILSFTVQRNVRFRKIYIYLLYLNLTACVIGIFGHYKYDIISQEFREFYTNHMIYLGGACPIICLSLIIIELITAPLFNNFYHVILASAILFCVGGIIGSSIHEINVTIPAHYHGMIVGISVAFMGFAYLLILNRDNNEFFNIANILGNQINNHNLSKSQVMQIWLITVGQFIHIGGLTVAGGYGALRKDTSMILSSKAKFGLGLMGVGGLLAIIGGLMFVYICYKKLYSVKQPAQLI